MKAPKAPDPMATAQAQSGLNTDTALTSNLLNMTNTQGPWGSTSYNQTGTQSYTDSQGRTVSLPQFTQTTNYSPGQQAIFDQTQAAQQNIAGIANDQSAGLKDYLNTKFDFGQGTFNPSDVSFNNQDAANWSYDLAQQRIAPQQQQAQAALETQLTNKGIRPGSQAWNSEMQRLSQANNDQNNQLALTGRQQAFGEQLQTAQQNYNQGLGARQQNFQEAVTARNQPLNEIASLLSGSQIANPNNAATPTPQTQVGGVDYTGLVTNQYNQQAGAHNAMLGGLFGSLGAGAQAGIMMSDVRVKTDISRVGTLDNGLPVYAYRYIWGGPMQIGVMAQDVETIHPHAVHEIEGIKAVDYAEAVL